MSLPYSFFGISKVIPEPSLVAAEFPLDGVDLICEDLRIRSSHLEQQSALNPHPVKLVNGSSYPHRDAHGFGRHALEGSEQDAHRLQ